MSPESAATIISDEAIAIKREVNELVERQIQALKQESPLTDLQLLDYRLRSERLRILYRALDRIAWTRVTFGFPRTA